MNDEIVICTHECDNSYCPHCMEACPDDGTEVLLRDLFGTPDCKKEGDNNGRREEGEQILGFQ